MTTEAPTLPIASIEASKTNPRKDFPDDYIAELADSVSEVGVLQPILVRPVGAHYEIVAGECRWRAAKKAGLSEIPVTVRELDDEAAERIQLIENVQRRDLHWTEEARTLLDLHERHGEAIEELAKRVGKTKPYVHGRVALARMPKKVLDLLAKRQAPVTVALALGRIADPKLQAQAAEEVTATRRSWSAKARAETVSPAFTVEGALRHLKERYSLQLKSAPFDTKDADLVKAAGACSDCPKRSGSQPALFEGFGADRCTDPVCFQKKTRAHLKAFTKEREAAGDVVLSEAETQKVFQHSHIAYSAPYLRQNEKPREQSGKLDKTWSQLVGKDNRPPTVWAFVEGQFVKLFRRDEAHKAAIANGAKWLESKGGGGTRRKQTAKDQSAAHAARVKSAQTEAVRVEVIRKASLLAGVEGYIGEKLKEGVRLMTLTAVQEVWHDRRRQLCKRLGLEQKGDTQGTLQRWAKAKDRTLDELLGALVDTLTRDSQLDAAAKVYGVRPGPIRAKVARDMKPKPKKKAAKKTTRKKAAKRTTKRTRGQASKKTTKKRVTKRARKKS